jgi:hypothetical protein
LIHIFKQSVEVDAHFSSFLLCHSRCCGCYG